MKILKVGTIKNRHIMPVDTYIFSSLKTPNDFRWIEQYAFDFFKKLVYNDLKTVDYPKIKPVSHIGTKTDLWLEADVELHLYITGLTQATLGVINAARRMHIHNIIVYHYDIVKHDFMPQQIVY